MAFERQRWLWGNDRTAKSVGQVGTRLTSNAAASQAVETVNSDELRSRLLELLQSAGQPVELREVRLQLGQASPYLDQDPQANPVNRLVKELRDAGELLVHEFDRGEPLVSLPEREPPAESPPEEIAGKRHELPLIRPDRQQTFDGEPVEIWPTPKFDPTAITVDRPRDDLDGPAHRFIVRCEDFVEVLISSDDARIGEALEIDHIRGRVLISFREGDEDEAWFPVERIFPTTEEPMSSRSTTSRLLTPVDH